MSDILKVLAPVRRDDSITKSEMRTYLPFIQNGLKKSDEIRIPIQAQSSFIHPHESYLYIEIEVTDIQPATLESATLCKYFPLFMFSEIRVELYGVTLDSVKNPGITVAMKSNVSQSFAETAQASEMVSSSIVVKKNQKLYYCIPAKNLMGYFEDQKRALILSPLMLVLVRSRTDKNCVFHVTEANKPACENVELEILKIAWRMRHVEFKDTIKLNMLKMVEKGVKLPNSFTSWDCYNNPNLGTTDHALWQVKTFAPIDKPLFVIVGFQTNRIDNVQVDSTIFDHCKILNSRLYLNSQVFPCENLDLDFDNDKYAIAYQMFTEFQSAYYGEPGKQKMTMQDYKTNSPLLVFNCTHTDPAIKISSIDMRLEFDFHAALPEKTVAYCLILYERVIYYNPFTGLVEKQM